MPKNFSTVTTQDALLPPEEAVMVVVPDDTAVTLPKGSTVATRGSLLLQTMRLSVASSGVTVATKRRLSPSTRFT